MIKNKFNINDIVNIGDDEEYRIVGIYLDVLSDKCKTIWYKLYRLTDGYACDIKESIIELIS